MNDTSIYDDEVIADSEGEEGDLMIPMRQIPAQMRGEQAKTAASASIISEFTAVKPTAETVSDFLSNAANQSAISKDTISSGSSVRPRPKPRPKYKGARADSINESSSSSNAVSNDSVSGFPSLSIADRAKLRTRDSKTRTSCYDASGTSSDSVQPFSYPKPNPSEVIELSDDELSLGPIAPRAAKNSKKPQLLSKYTSHRSIVPSPDPSPQAYLPIATSPLLATTSQLPPSDPPQSTSDMDFPPIVTLPNAPSSSPLSPPPKASRSKRRLRVEELDELEFSVDSIDMDRQIMPPPPIPQTPSNFFASSSPPARAHPEVIDLSALDSSFKPSTPVAPQTGKARQTKKPRKKLNEDDDAEKAKSTKANSKVKARPFAQVDVVINLPPKKGKSKGKSSRKEQKQEVVKSREIIEEEFGMGAGESNRANQSAPTTTASVAPDTEKSVRPKARTQKRDSDTFESVEDEEAPPKKKQKTKTDVKSTPKITKSKGKGRAVIVSDEEDANSSEEVAETAVPRTSGRKRSSPGSSSHIDETEVASNSKAPKENVDPSDASSSDPTDRHVATETPAKEAKRTPLSSRYTIAPRTKSTPMSELIRRVNSLPGSPFISPAPRASSKNSTVGTAYSPYLKSSRSVLSRIAPLHPNRRTPPPPLPPPPPKKKTKKEIEREEQWEEELIESVGGITEWACMTDQERKEMRKAKREREMNGWED